MIFLLNDTKKIIGTQEFPETTTAPHIIVSNTKEQTIIKLKAVIGFVILNQNNELPYSWYEDALLLKNTDNINTEYQKKFLEIHENANNLAFNLNSKYSEIEKTTFTKQRAEAEAYNADNQMVTPKLDQLASDRGIDRVLFIVKVLAAINEADDLSFKIVGAQQAKEDELAIAKQTSLSALQSVDTTLTI
jgi:hypothetical protein